MPKQIRVLVVDDVALFRKVVRDACAEVDGVEVVGVAADGMAALQKIEDLTPDLVILDIEMPRLDGLGVLKALKLKPNSPGVLVLSGNSSIGISSTVRCLELGAFDFIVKPQTNSLVESLAYLRTELTPRLTQFQRFEKSRVPTIRNTREYSTDSCPEPAETLAKNVQAIGIGVSTGGPEALKQLIPRLPVTLAAPVFIVQHMPPGFTKSLANDLNSNSALNVIEAQGGEFPCSGSAYIAPGGSHMRVVVRDKRRVIEITDDVPENSCRPSVDYLFRSLAKTYGASVLGVVMTGMGSDGEAGARELKERGASIIVQDRPSCVVYGMPRAVQEAGLADQVFPLSCLDKPICQSAGGVTCS